MSKRESKNIRRLQIVGIGSSNGIGKREHFIKHAY